LRPDIYPKLPFEGARTVAGAILLELSLVCLALVANKSGGFGSQDVVSGSLGAAALAGALGILTGAFLLARAFNESAGRRRIRFWRPLAVNLGVVALLVVVGETALRAVARDAELGERVGSVPLRPLDWQQVVATNRRLLEQNRSERALHQADDVLGWNVGKNRISADGMYRTSAEGVRGATRGDHLAARKPRRRVALVGDSFTFGEEVPFEQTWGHYLEQGLGSDTQVLNFGVISHGVDQTLLKYKREVVQWGAQVTVLGFLSSVALRSANVYLFLRPDQEQPYSKPRFTLANGELRLLNVPNVSPEQMLSRRSIFELPLIEQDLAFSREEWEAHPLDSSYIARYLLSRFPRWPARSPELSDEAVLDLTSRLFGEFVAAMRDARSSPLIVSLPVRADLNGEPPRRKEALIAALTARGISVIDPTQCLLERLTVAELFITGGSHYTATGNATLAECLRPYVASALGSVHARSDGSHRSGS
jgi:hypothetical protein